MSTSAWLLGALTVVLGAALSLASEWVRRRWHRNDAELERRLNRSEAAAEEALQLVAAIVKRLRQHRSIEEVPEQREMEEEFTRPMRDVALRIGDAEVRTRLESIATVAEQLQSVEAMDEYEPHRIAAAVDAAGRNVVAHVLSGEPLTDPSPITRYTQMVEEDWQLMEEAKAEHRAENSGRATLPPEA